MEGVSTEAKWQQGVTSGDCHHGKAESAMYLNHDVLRENADVAHESGYAEIPFEFGLVVPHDCNGLSWRDDLYANHSFSV
jgi:hypothetical protein